MGPFYIYGSNCVSYTRAVWKNLLEKSKALPIASSQNSANFFKVMHFYDVYCKRIKTTSVRFSSTLKSSEIVLFVFASILKNMEQFSSFFFDLTRFGTMYLCCALILKRFWIDLFVFSSIPKIWNYICLHVFDLEKFRACSLRFSFDL